MSAKFTREDVESLRTYAGIFSLLPDNLQFGKIKVKERRADTSVRFARQCHDLADRIEAELSPESTERLRK